MALLPNLPAPLRLVLLKLLATCTGGSFVFATLVWALGRRDSMQVLFLSSAILVTVSSVIVFAVLGELAALQTRKPVLRFVYPSFGIAVPVLAVFALAGYGVVLSVALQVAALLAAPTKSAEHTIGA